MAAVARWNEGHGDTIKGYKHGASAIVNIIYVSNRNKTIGLAISK